MSFRSSAPITSQSPVTFSDPLPSEVDVVIVGAGVIGIMSALYLRRAGSVRVRGREGPGGGRAVLAQLGLDPPARARRGGASDHDGSLAAVGADRWRDRQRTGFRRTGIMYLASTDKEMEERAKWLDVARRHQLDVRAIDGDAVAAGSTPGPAASDGAGAVWSPTDARGEPWVAVPAVAQLAHSEGVGIRENCAIRTIRNQGRETVRRAHRARFHCRVAGGGGRRRLDIAAVAQSGHIPAAALGALDGDAHRADARGL
jgi:glycine/D-amino acid oxidase-like deaminating enzyme